MHLASGPLTDFSAAWLRRQNAVPQAGSDGLLQFGSHGAARILALDTFADAFAGSDPTSLHFARPSSAAQRAFWVNYVSGHILDSQPSLNFLAQGGGGAIVANVLPDQEAGYLASTWRGLRLLLASVPPAKWRAAAAYGDFLHAKQRAFRREHGPFLLVTLIGVRPALQCQGIGSRLLERVLRYADTHSLPSYLEASSERSRRLYLRHGFQDIETWHGPFPVFLMWRPTGALVAAAAAAAASTAAAAEASSLKTPPHRQNHAASEEC